MLESFSTVRTSLTTTDNIATIIQGQSKRVINYYIQVADSINDMATLKKLNQQWVPQNPFGPIMGALPEVANLGVDIHAQVAVDLVNFGVQDCYDNIALHLFVSGLRPHMRKAFASDAKKRATIPNSKPPGATSLRVLSVEDNDANANTVKTEAELVAALEEAEKLKNAILLFSKQKSTVFVAIICLQGLPTLLRPHRPPDCQRKPQIWLPKTLIAATVDKKVTSNLRLQ